ncbi:carbohydrate ABC transporter permease [Catenuloplanes atrovinosus]|uniref:Multiple sugar transport system permease protein n=1 Tax=Catenuloplanes atrovinosus TaxID=137266 RepID=A0AAE4C938_9ACTN|nr:sugar ABC transporter permease [Catenuloplanes atrovinosus]MDR7273225.1 multiple sugar transport system permease protein [Catenuloplanes atrovinosus]
MTAVLTEPPLTNGRTASRRRARLRRAVPGYLMLLPFAGLFLGFLIWPLLNALYFAFTDFNGVRPPSWVGTENFRRLWLDDPRFRKALVNSLIYVALAVTLTTAAALTLALAFRGTSWRDRVMRTIFFLPSVTSTIAVMLIWRWIFSGERFGLANTVLSWFGAEPVSWLSTPRWTIPLLVLMAVWGGCGYGMVIFVSGLNAIPEELYEAARLDGAGGWQQFRYVTLPQLRPVTTYVVITGLIGAFQVFEAVYIVFRAVSSVGGVQDGGLMLVPYLYDMGFTKFQLGYASAIAWTLFLIIFVISMIQLRVTRALREL